MTCDSLFWKFNLQENKLCKLYIAASTAGLKIAKALSERIINYLVSV